MCVGEKTTQSLPHDLDLFVVAVYCAGLFVLTSFNRPVQPNLAKQYRFKTFGSKIAILSRNTSRACSVLTPARRQGTAWCVHATHTARVLKCALAHTITKVGCMLSCMNSCVDFIRCFSQERSTCREYLPSLSISKAPYRRAA